MKSIKNIFAFAAIALAIAAAFAIGPVAGILVLGIGSFAFASQKTNVLGFNTQFYDSSQLQLNEIADTAIRKAYGQRFENGAWISNGGDPLPDFDGLALKKTFSSIYTRTYLGTADVKLHAVQTGPNKALFKCNNDSNSTGNNRLFVAFGLRLRTASGASNALMTALDFDITDVTDVKNGHLQLSMNGNKVIEDLGVDGAIVSIPEIKGYYRFPEVQVLKPNMKWEAEINMLAIPATTWAELELVGFWVETKSAK